MAAGLSDPTNFGFGLSIFEDPDFFTILSLKKSADFDDIFARSVLSAKFSIFFLTNLSRMRAGSELRTLFLGNRI
jgi:hypothetical protein